jgi:hypothetical protein
VQACVNVLVRLVELNAQTAASRELGSLQW